ncbi:thrombospondin-related anonymous protein [Hepatocystis sp. ex Piliocolobus tephrosceles]|nr:thrombospondin-related anonymous protein [Hepatocystis sp. ex Piliocolobus tephrosceles]
MKLTSNKIYLFVAFFCYLRIFIHSSVTNTATLTYTEQICNEKMDIHLLLDGSWSIGDTNWDKYIYPLTLKLTNMLNISPHSIKLGLILFNYDAEYIISYDSPISTDKTQVLMRLDNQLKNYRPYGNTNLTDALKLVIDKYNNKNFRHYNEKLVIIVTDGVPNSKEKALSNINILNNLGVKVIVFGVGSGVSNDISRQMAGCKDKDQNCPSYFHASWSNASERITPFIQKVCVDVRKKMSCGEWDSEWSACSVSCGSIGYKIKKRKSYHKNCTDTLIEDCYEGECPVPELEPTKISCGEWDSEWSACSVSCGKGIKTKIRTSNHESCTDTLTEECYAGECPIPKPKSKIEHNKSNKNNKYQNKIQKYGNSINSYIPQHDMINKDEERRYTYKNNKSSKQYYADVHNKIKNNNEDEEQKENNKKNQKPGVNNAYKVAGAILGGMFLLGCVGAAYGYIEKGVQLASLSKTSLFDNILPNDDTDTTENDEFKLPEDDDWQA